MRLLRRRPLRRMTGTPWSGAKPSATSAAGQADTIFALSTAPGVAAIAVFRLSGPRVAATAARILRRRSGSAGALPRARVAAVRQVVHPLGGQLLDEGLALWFPGPHSFTGEDMLELHVHGSRAVCEAHAGEFSLRAFENGKMDLTQAEGLADLLAAETAAQHRQALQQALGEEGNSLRSLYDGWREELAHQLARVEAAIDFVEEDIDDAVVLAAAQPPVAALRAAIAAHARQGLRGTRGRLGLRITLAGPPNAGKSALLNALAHRSAAIVTGVAGTTRDVVEVAAALGDPSTGAGGSLPVLLADTAGVRDGSTVGEVEEEGVRRAKARWAEADIRLLVLDLHALAPALAATDSEVTANSELSRKSQPKRQIPVLAVDTQGEALAPVVAELFELLASPEPELQPSRDARSRARHSESLGWPVGVVLSKSDLLGTSAIDASLLRGAVGGGGSGHALATALARAVPVLSGVVDATHLPIWVVSTETGEGMEALSQALSRNVDHMLRSELHPEGGAAEGESGHGGCGGVGAATEGDAAIPTRARHLQQLNLCLEALDSFETLVADVVAAGGGSDELELAAEELRAAMRCLGRLTGAVGVEELLDVIFREFCVGK